MAQEASRGAKKKRRKAGEHGTNRPGGRRISEKTERELAKRKWIEALRQQFVGQVVGLEQIESVMPSVFLGAKKPASIQGDMVKEAVRIGVLKDVGCKKWKVLPSTGRPSEGASRSLAEVVSERDPLDRGELAEIQESEWKRAKEEFYRAFHEKRSGVTLSELQERREFFRPYAWAAIKQWFVAARLMMANGDSLVVRKPNTHLYRGGKDLYVLTAKGQDELIWARRQLREAENVPVLATQLKTATRTLKREMSVASGKFDFTTLSNQSQVVGVAPAGFSKDSEKQTQALVLFAALLELAKVVTRDLFRQALRWKYQWGVDVGQVAVGRVVAGLESHGLINIALVRDDKMPGPDDVLTIGPNGTQVLSSMVDTSSPAPVVVQAAEPQLVPKAQPGTLEEVQHGLQALVQKVSRLEDRLGAAERDRDAYRKQAESAEQRIQVFVGAFAALIGRDGLVTILQMLGVDPATPPTKP